MVSKQVLSAALIIVHEAPPPWSIHFVSFFRRGSKFSSSVEGPTQFLGGHGFALPVIVGTSVGAYTSRVCAYDLRVLVQYYVDDVNLDNRK
jgi:hypothetical protein